MTDIILKIPEIKQYMQNLQIRLCQMLEQIDGKELFLTDQWTKGEGNGGITRAMNGGAVIEKAGVNFSHVKGTSLPSSATSKRPECTNQPFQAMGVSAIIHPKNPYAPTAHANIRFVIIENEEGKTRWWFGGGFDLTPYYGFMEDCQYWHQTAKEACDPFGDEVYSRFKKACDDYFYLKHRNEQRGVGGIFFDDLNEWGFEKSFAFTKGVGEHFIQAYCPILEKRKSLSYTVREREFQLYRRGRYVEFNLLYDRGTLFGLQSGGRTESILISLPPNVSWKYGEKMDPHSPEGRLVTEFLIKRNWIE